MSRRSDSGLDGILLVDKPGGWTSHDVVAKARRITGQRRIGHTGTLDPMATGLLVLCLGQGTRLVEYLTGHDKRYAGIVTLGTTTTTDDAEGEVISTRPTPPLDADVLSKAVLPFEGAILQRPPAFSALKVDGQRAYKLARQGAEPNLAARRVTIRQFAASVRAGDAIDIDVTCSAGTYIRSLARDLGEALGCGGHLSALRRLSAGPFSVEHAVSLEGLEAAVLRGKGEDLLLPVDEGVLALDAAILGRHGTEAVANGRAWEGGISDSRERETLRIYSAMGEFIGMGSATNSGEIRAHKVFLRPKSAK